MARTPNYPNVDASLYEEGFAAYYSCPGRCARMLAEIMPPPPEAICTFSDCGNCRNRRAQIAALQALKQQINREIKALTAGLDQE